MRKIGVPSDCELQAIAFLNQQPELRDPTRRRTPVEEALWQRLVKLQGAAYETIHAIRERGGIERHDMVAVLLIAAAGGEPEVKQKRISLSPVDENGIQKTALTIAFEGMLGEGNKDHAKT